MKIGILTHPQAANYGGILQCYALTSFLKRQGHDTIIIRRVSERSFFLWVWIRHVLKVLHFPRYYNVSQDVVDRTVNIRPFVEKYIKRTPPIDTQCEMKRVCKKYGLDAVIVGSDQVWRKSFAMPFGYNFFLDFVPSGVIKISYAASFGLSEWQYDAKETLHIRKLLNRFQAISVREEEAVGLCEQHLNLTVTHMIDPTLLLRGTDYDDICSPQLVDYPYTFVYWLGDKDEMFATLSPFLTDKTIIINLRDSVEQISVEDWLSYIKYADLVLTDSFHGCVFSLLFHRPLKVFKNGLGGYGRITTLLKDLDIDNKDLMRLSEKDYDLISEKLCTLREKALFFLRQALN